MVAPSDSTRSRFRRAELWLQRQRRSAPLQSSMWRAIRWVKRKTELEGKKNARSGWTKVNPRDGRIEVWAVEAPPVSFNGGRHCGCGNSTSAYRRRCRSFIFPLPPFSSVPFIDSLHHHSSSTAAEAATSDRPSRHHEPNRRAQPNQPSPAQPGTEWSKQPNRTALWRQNSDAANWRKRSRLPKWKNGSLLLSTGGAGWNPPVNVLLNPSYKARA